MKAIGVDDRNQAEINQTTETELAEQIRQENLALAAKRGMAMETCLILKGPMWGNVDLLTLAWRSGFTGHTIHIDFMLYEYVATDSDGQKVKQYAHEHFGFEVTDLRRHNPDAPDEMHPSLNRQGCAEISGIVMPPVIRSGQEVIAEHMADKKPDLLPKFLAVGDRIRFIYSMSQQVGRLVEQVTTNGMQIIYHFVPLAFASNDGFPECPIITAR